ncbi:MAG: YwiC-like family protein [Acidobacteria bacterium]|nr:YwiC-like family protein [Acidobacteriota bacterium]MBV9067421.1 YwiC-like family protein [Acidobacteriota bacterium]MBV9187468.1 YwiC-like family protein [Acidobacteriota bacterium]
MATTLPIIDPRVSLRPIALPAEHGGWGFLLEPIALGLAVRPSWGGALIAIAFAFGFLTRQPLRLALQDLLRGRSYPRTRWCWTFALLYAFAACGALATAVIRSGWVAIIPIGLVVPLGVMQIFYDAHKRGRALLPELGGALAMTSSAAAIAIAGGLRIVPALALSAVIAARAIPSIVFVRTLLRCAHGRSAASWPAVSLHAIAILLVALCATKLAVVAMIVLFTRAVWTLARPVPPAKTIGYGEIGYGAMTVVLAAI